MYFLFSFSVPVDTVLEDLGKRHTKFPHAIPPCHILIFTDSKLMFLYFNRNAIRRNIARICIPSKVVFSSTGLNNFYTL